MATVNPHDAVNEPVVVDVKKLPLHRLWEIAQAAYDFVEADTQCQSSALAAYQKFKKIVGA